MDNTSKKSPDMRFLGIGLSNSVSRMRKTVYISNADEF
jgi:hypothetical protein